MNENVTIFTRDLVKRFKTKSGAVTAVDGVTLQVRRGETYGLIGPDGAGKTTTTRVILGLLERSGGESRILGYDSMRDTYAIRERVGYIAQQFALPADLTVMENMRFFANIQSVSRKDQRERIPELLEFAGLSAFTKRLAGRLSGGMKKKLALACSLVHEPDVVMLDEPTLGVDPVSRREFWGMLGDLRTEKGLTIFFCTPYMDEAERCNWVGLMYEGQLIAHDSPETIKQMVPGRLLEFTPSNFVPAWRLVPDLEGVLEVQTYGVMLHVFVDDVGKRRREIETALAAQGITCEGMREIEPRMEEAFISLIRKQRREE
ncbi:MAG: ABC transporter ATP-binding protein [Chloroflexi bacterium]|nr:MAG: ABC transporter ATP-binding protein [Chloroflexota bacterium]RLC87539.1 MAG: ABC transporter ATP-binding protein [Chloroflexota bacterium]HEY72789.1 ABC transporter ATP-binding protein [Thermoflexia bacterium]